jgi:membrane-associated phospholipid phosphatase
VSWVTPGLAVERFTRPPVVQTTHLDTDVAVRVRLAVVLTIWFVVIYSLAGTLAAGRAPYDVRMPVDGWIPFKAWTVFVYVSAFPAVFLPLFVVRCRHLLNRAAWANASVIFGSAVIFVLFPVHAVGLRTTAALVPADRFPDWLVTVVHHNDTLANLFPSLHVSLATLTAATLWRADRRYGFAAAAGVALLMASTWTIKQHYVADGVGGLAVGACAAWVAFRSYRPSSAQYPLLAPSALGYYAGFHTCFLLALYACFLV